MSERKPSERWVVHGDFARLECLPFIAVALGNEWVVYLASDPDDVSVANGESASFEAAQLAAEDALLEIAREIREAVRRE